MSENTGAVKEESPTKNVEELIEVLSTKPETPTLNQDSPKNDFFILQDFWPLFKFSQILGFFPCKKEMDEKGAMELKPIRWWISVIRILGLSIFVTIPRVLLGLLLSSSEEASDYINNEFLPRVFLSNSARSYVTHFFEPVTVVLLLSCFLSFVIKRKKLCALQAIFSSPLNDMTMKRTNTVRKARVYSILIITLSLIAIVATVLYIYLPLLKLLTNNASIVLGIFIAFLNGMSSCIFIQIMINTVILYFQLTCNIINLIEEIDLDSMKLVVILENTANLMKKVKMTSSFLSLQCFFMILHHTAMLIVQIFSLCDYLTGTSQFPPTTYVAIVATILWSTLILCIVNWQSYDVKQRLSEIRFHIFNFAITENNLVVLEKQKHPEEYARNVVMSMIDEFKGFDANGYFTLGKELLGGIIMLCITYVFVLIRFRTPIN